MLVGLLRRAPGENFLPACSVVLGTFRKQPAFAPCTHKRWPQACQPAGFGHPKCLTLELGRTVKFSYGALDSRLAIFSEMVRQWV